MTRQLLEHMTYLYIRGRCITDWRMRFFDKRNNPWR